jgi:hypothetical protein
MAWQDDPDPDMRPRMTREDLGYMIWVLSGLALFIIAGVMIFAASMHDDTQTRPAVAVPANPSPPATTGSDANTGRD